MQYEYELLSLCHGSIDLVCPYSYTYYYFDTLASFNKTVSNVE
jgi:hypothetical protein